MPCRCGRPRLGLPRAWSSTICTPHTALPSSPSATSLDTNQCALAANQFTPRTSTTSVAGKIPESASINVAVARVTKLRPRIRMDSLGCRTDSRIGCLPIRRPGRAYANPMEWRLEWTSSAKRFTVVQRVMRDRVGERGRGTGTGRSARPTSPPETPRPRRLRGSRWHGKAWGGAGASPGRALATLQSSWTSAAPRAGR